MSRTAALAVVVLWLAGVLFVARHHEFWRDEVRALSIARAASFPWDLVGLTRNEGHPLLWYVLLYAGTCVTASSLVLPFVSIAVAFGAVVLLMLFSPIPVWLGAAFTFGLPFYEYSVSARNYGISMLLMFAAAHLYRERATHPLRLASVLALLANTNAHSTMLACLFALLWVSEGPGRSRSASRPSAFALLVVAAGLALAATVALPRSDSVTMTWIGFDSGRIVQAIGDTLVDPGRTYVSLVRSSPFAPPVFGLSIAVALLGLSLLLRFFAVAVAAMLALGLFFRTIYAGGLRHEALLLVFVFALYWILLDERIVSSASRPRRWLFYSGIYAALPVLFAAQVFIAGHLANLDVAGQASSSKAFGAFLATTDYRDAILVPEPDYLVESVPYYAANRIYLAREHRFGTTASFTSASDRALSLGQLLAAARKVRAETRQKVLLVLGHPELRGETREVTFSYGKVFTWTDEDTRDMNDSLSFVASFGTAYGDENYNVYELR